MKIIKNGFKFEQVRFIHNSCIVKITCIDGIPQSDTLEFDAGVAYDSYKCSMYTFEEYVDAVTTH